jgi:cytochrome c oxidase subunit 2
MFFVGYKGFAMMRNVPEGAKVIRVTGSQWKWVFDYPDEKINLTNELYLPVDTAVKFELSSLIDDVLHSFYLPDFRVKEDCVPGRPGYMWIQTPEEPGEFNFFCAEYCGRDHAKMLGKLVVLSQADYERRIEAIIAELNRPVEDLHVAMDPQAPEYLDIDAEALYQTNCLSCHGANGRGEAETNITDARDFTSLEGWTREEAGYLDIFRAITEGNEGTQMRSFGHLSPWNRFALMHYVAHFYQSEPPREMPSDAALAQLNEEYQLDKAYEPGDRISIEAAMEAIVNESPGTEE